MQRYVKINNEWQLEETAPDLSDYAKTADLATVATTGNYSDLIGAATKTSDLTNDSNFISDANYVHTDNNYTNADKARLASLGGASLDRYYVPTVESETTTLDEPVKKKYNCV